MSATTIIQWNDYLLEIIKAEGAAPPVAARAMSTVQTAVFDAVNAAEGSAYQGYSFTDRVSTSNLNADAAAISAAYHTIKSLFPSYANNLSNLYQTSLSSVTGGVSVSDSVALGQNIAASILSLRAQDGSKAVVNYNPEDDIGIWEPAPPSYTAPLLPQWPNVTPWTMTEGEQFRPPTPPEVTSSEYTEAYNEVKELGSTNSATRTADQTEIALFWADGKGTVTPPGHWQEIAQTLVAAQDLSTLEAARLFALLSLAVADAAIIAWDAKYTYDNWRPVWGIAKADEDGNPLTSSETGWTPLISTPPFPDYISGHSTFSGASAVILSEFFGNDALAFSTTSDGLSGVVRSYDSLWEAALEAGKSRIYGGIHWEFSNAKGLEAGANLAHYVSDSFLLERDDFTASADNVTLTIAGRACYLHEGNDQGQGSSSTDRIYGGSGSDSISGNQGNDVLFGGKSRGDALDSADEIRGGAGNDSLYGNSGDDLLFGGNGIVDSSDGADWINAGSGNDKIYANGSNDSVYGAAGNDSIFGGLGDDRLFGDSASFQSNDGNDLVYGNDGNDLIAGGAGNDTLHGGAGQDLYYFDKSAGDDLVNFESGVDKLLLYTGEGGFSYSVFDPLANHIAQLAGHYVLLLGDVTVTLMSNQVLTVSDIQFTTSQTDW